MTKSITILAAALLAGAASAGAQGTLSGQGFGYPTGQWSARAMATGGALGEFDPQSLLNPASITGFGRSALFFQYAPEFRRIRANGIDDLSRVMRFPGVGASIAVSERGTVAVSASTLLDRSFTSAYLAPDTIGEEIIQARREMRSSGAINDVRVAGGWVFGRTLRVGLGLHAMTGRNRIVQTRVYTGRTNFLPVVQSFDLSYGGTALSAGVEWRPITWLALAGSGRYGGALRAYREDALLRTARVPNRFGVSVGFDGIPGASIVAGTTWSGWSSMEPLSQGDTTSFSAHDAWTSSVGAEVAGPTWFGVTVPLRAGLMTRTLPFGANGAVVRETAVGGGSGFLFARGRARTDLAVQRARRSAAGLPNEDAWTVSLGITVHP